MVRLVVGGVIALLVLSACSLGDLLKGGSSLTIGAIYPLTGPQAKGGQEDWAG